MRARIKKRQRNRNITLIAIAAVVVVVIIGVGYSLYSLTSSVSPLIGQPVSASIYSSLSTVASSSSYGPDNPTLVAIRSSSNPNAPVQTVSGEPYISGGKPVILFIGGEFCPLCAFQRWPMVIALMRFGNLSNLTYMQSSSTDSDPNTSTFSFLNVTSSSYTSKYIVFEHYEQEDRNHNPLQTVPSNYSTVFTQFGSGYPFLDFANKYVIEGSYFEPTAFAGLNWTQIVQQIQNPSSTIYSQVMTSANAITALICNVTGGTPNNVCGNVSITGLTATLTSYHPSASATMLASTATPATYNTYSLALVRRVDILTISDSHF